MDSILTMPSRAALWADFAAQALAGNLSRNAPNETQVEIAARSADRLMEEFDKRFVFDTPNQCWIYRKRVTHEPPL